MDLYLSSSPAIAPSHSLVIVAGGGRDLLWLPAQIAAVLLARTSGQLVHGLLHGGARGADRAIGRAAFQLGWPVEVLPADWRRHGRAAGPIRNRELLELAISRAEALSSAAAPTRAEGGVLRCACHGPRSRPHHRPDSFLCQQRWLPALAQ